MKKILKLIKHHIILTLSIVFSITLISGFIIFTNTKHNLEVKDFNSNSYGNTAGNLYNNGFFCDYDNRIFFKNIKDNGSLYSMSYNLDDFKKISSDNVSYINANGNYLFYSRMNIDNSATSLISSFNNTGLYRCTLNGKKLTTLYDQPTGLVSQFDSYVYYQHYDQNTGLTLYKVRYDGNDEMKISNHASLPGCYIGDDMYYSDMSNTHYIIKYDTKNGVSTTFLSERSMYPIVSGNYMYYMSIDNNYSLYRYPLSGGEPEQIIKERCATYNISLSDKYLYYQTDGEENNNFCCLDLSTGKKTILKSGDYCNINITSNYVFFTDIHSEKCYYIENGKTKIHEFVPPSA